MQKPAHYLPAHLNVEEDVGPIKTFIQDTTAHHEAPRLHRAGARVSEAYHRTCVLVSEIKRTSSSRRCARANGKGRRIHLEEGWRTCNPGRRGDVSEVVKKAG